MHGYAEAVKIQPSSCLEEGWVHPGEDEIDCAKVLTFLASKGRINDDRMIKVKPLPNDKFEKGHFSALERERMMGFPEGYVQGAGALRGLAVELNRIWNVLDRLTSLLLVSLSLS